MNKIKILQCEISLYLYPEKKCSGTTCDAKELKRKTSIPISLKGQAPF